MKRLILIVVLFASILANAQVVGVYCEKTTIAPGEETTLRFVVTNGPIQYFCYTDGIDYCVISNMVGNVYTETVRPSVDTRYRLTYVEPGSIDPQHMEVYVQVFGDPVNVQTKFDLPESCFDTDDPIHLKPLFWSNVPYYSDLVEFDGPGVVGEYFYPNRSGEPGVKSIRAHLVYHGAEHGITRDIKVIRYGTGIDESLQEISVYPNPTNGFLNLPKPCITEIYSATGLLVKRFDSIMDVIDISDLSCGAYFVKMIDGEQTIVQKIIKQ